MERSAASFYRFSILRFISGVLFHIAIISGLTWLFCWGAGVYTARKAADALFMICFCYTLVGITTWASRAMRFYNQSEHFRGVIKVSEQDRSDLAPRERGWLLIIFENRIFIPWVLAGLLLLVASSILWKTFPPDFVLRFLVRPGLPAHLRPGF